MHPATSRNRLCVTFALTAALAACKSGAARPPELGADGAPPEMAITGSSLVTGGSISYRLDNSYGGVTRLVRATPAETWKTVLVTYGDLQLPITALDVEKHRISSSEARAPRKLGGKPLREYIDCGSGVAGPRVDSHDVAYTLVTVVSPAGADSTAVHSTLVASASSRGGTSTAPVACSTTGQLEKRIAQLIALKLDS
jgi:hypothetical protein